MRKWIVIGIAFLLGCCPVTANAASGSIEIQLEEGGEYNISYCKVGDMINGRWVLEDDFLESEVNLNEVQDAKALQMAAKEMLFYINERQLHMEKQMGTRTIVLEDLEEGVYLISCVGNKEEEMLPILVSVPGWSEEERVYHVTVIPKFVVRETAPVTGWDSLEGSYAAMAGISFGVLVALFLYKRRYNSK